VWCTAVLLTLYVCTVLVYVFYPLYKTRIKHNRHKKLVYVFYTLYKTAWFVLYSDFNILVVFR